MASRRNVILATTAAIVAGALAPVLIGPAGDFVRGLNDAGGDGEPPALTTALPPSDQAPGGTAPSGTPPSGQGGAQGGQQQGGGPPPPGTKKVAPIALHRFTPDDTTEAGCTDAKCWMQALGNVAYRKGGKAGIAAYEAARTRPGLADVMCEPVLYVVGLAAGERDAGKAMEAATGQCGGAYRTGVLAAIVGDRTGKAAASATAKACTPEDGGELQREDRICVSTAGRTLMVAAKWDGEQTLEWCDTLVQDLRQNCYDGVFLEHRTPIDPTAKQRWNRPKQVEYPCDVVDDQYRRACYSQLVVALINKDGDYGKVTKVCNDVDKEWLDICAASIGYFLGGSIPVRSPDDVFKACRSLSAEAACVQGSATLMAINAGEDAAVSLCRKARRAVAQACFEGLGQGLRSKGSTQAEIERVCRRAAGPHADACAAPPQGPQG